MGRTTRVPSSRVCVSLHVRVNSHPRLFTGCFLISLDLMGFPSVSQKRSHLSSISNHQQPYHIQGLPSSGSALIKRQHVSLCHACSYSTPRSWWLASLSSARQCLIVRLWMTATTIWQQFLNEIWWGWHHQERQNFCNDLRQKIDDLLTPLRILFASICKFC